MFVGRGLQPGDTSPVWPGARQAGSASLPGSWPVVGDCACRGEVVLVHDEHELMVVVTVLDVEDNAGVGHHSGQGAELARCLLIQSHITTSQTATTGSPAAARAVLAVLGSLTRKCATPTPPWGEHAAAFQAHPRRT